MSLNKAPRDVASYMISKQMFVESLKNMGFNNNDAEKIMKALNDQDSYLRKNFRWM